MMVNREQQVVCVPNGYRGPDGNFNASHFLGHVGEAADILGIPTVTFPVKKYWDILSHRYENPYDLFRAVASEEGIKWPE